MVATAPSRTPPINLSAVFLVADTANWPERRTMSVLRWKSFTATGADSLCATCVWGTTRKGYRSGDVEIFCRFISPNTVVPFPVRTCTDYTDRRAPSAPADTNSTSRRFGFVTTLSLHESAERVSDSDPSANDQ